MFDKRGPSFAELTKQALSSTNAGYDLLAEKFEFTPFRTPDAVLEEISSFIEREHMLCEAALDVCTGTGAGLQMLRKHAQRAVGIDRSFGMLEKGRRLLSEKDGCDFELVQGDALSMPFRAEFDLAVSFGAFGHVEEDDTARFLRAVHSALKPDGRFLFITRYPPEALSIPTLAARAFNGVMRVRNALISPPFIMYYLTFLLPEIRNLLEANGFWVMEHQIFSGNLKEMVLVEAIKR